MEHELDSLNSLLLGLPDVGSFIIWAVGEGMWLHHYLKKDQKTKT